MIDKRQVAREAQQLAANILICMARLADGTPVDAGLVTFHLPSNDFVTDTYSLPFKAVMSNTRSSFRLEFYARDIVADPDKGEIVLKGCRIVESFGSVSGREYGDITLRAAPALDEQTRYDAMEMILRAGLDPAVEDLRRVYYGVRFNREAAYRALMAFDVSSPDVPSFRETGVFL